MENIQKRLVSNVSIGLVAGVFTMVVSLLRTVILGSSLSLEEFGYFIICFNLLNMVRLFLRVGVSDTVLRFYPEFQNSERRDQQTSLVILVVLIASVITGIVWLAAILFGSVIAVSWYQNPDLGSAIIWLAILTGGFLFGEAAQVFLRVTNKFNQALFPPALGALIALISVVLLEKNGSLGVTTAVIAVGFGEFIGVAICTILAAFRIKPELEITAQALRLKPLVTKKKELRSTLTQTSLFGILDSSTQIGGTFLLGLLGTPAQVAILGMAVQLTRPLGVIQSAIGSAVAPEVTKAYTQRRFSELRSLVFTHLKIGSGVVTIGMVIAWFAFPPVIEHFLRVEYLAAFPIFMVLLLSVGLVICFQPFLPLAIARGEVGRRNLAVCVRFLYLGIACWLGLTAMGVALVLLAGNLTIRIFNDLPLMRELRKTREPILAGGGN